MNDELGTDMKLRTRGLCEKRVRKYTTSLGQGSRKWPMRAKLLPNRSLKDLPLHKPLGSSATVYYYERKWNKITYEHHCTFRRVRTFCNVSTLINRPSFCTNLSANSSSHTSEWRFNTNITSIIQSTQLLFIAKQSPLFSKIATYFGFNFSSWLDSP